MGKEQFQNQPEVQHHSYESFTQRPFYKEINRQTIKDVPHSNHFLDIATGTGGMFELLKEAGHMESNAWMVVGIDIDEAALEEARGKFENYSFIKGSAENTGMDDEEFDLITFCNAIHLTDVPNSLKEAYRVLEKGGTFIANSAFVDGLAYPNEEAQKLWINSLGVGAMKKAMRAGYKPERNTDFVTYKVEDYVRMAEEAGFVDVTTSVIEAQMDKEDVLAICHYDEFASGVLKGVPLEIAHKALRDTAEEIFARIGEIGTFPRNWMVLSAKKA